MTTAEKIARDRALALMYAQASGQRVLATEVHAGAKTLAASHHRTAELINQLAAAAPQIWAQSTGEGS